jgi:predicted nucleotidyltransferase
VNYGLKQSDITSIVQAVAQFDDIEVAVIFGSRAKGNFKKASDIDIAIQGKAITSKTATGLRSVLEELPLPYFFDVVHYETIQNQDLTDHIDRVGEIIYQRPAFGERTGDS